MAADVRLAVCTIALTLAAGSAWADSVVLIDRSGSMRPYYGNGLAQRLTRDIVEASSATEAPDLKVFNTSVETSSPAAFSRVVPTGDTNLTKALTDHVGDYDRIWILTDNVQDLGAGAGRDMADFYAALQAEGIRTIYVFPLRQAPGAAGLLVYAMTTLAETEGLDRQVKRFEDLTQDLQVSKLLMKPLGENAIDVRIVGSNEELTFREGEPLAFENRITIRRKFDHVFFKSSPARTAAVSSPFAGDSCLVAEKGESDITPREVHTEGADQYSISVNFGRVSLRRNLNCLVHAAFVRSNIIERIETPVVIDVPRDRLRLSDAFLSDFAAASPDEATKSGKIFGLDKVPSFVAPETIHVRIPVPRTVKVEYGPMAAIILVGLGLITAAVVVVGGKAIVQLASPKLRVVAETEAGEPLHSTFDDQVVRVGNDELGRVDGTGFSPSPGVRLDPESGPASIVSPVTCVLPTGERIRLRFGKRLHPGSRERLQAGAAESEIELTER